MNAFFLKRGLGFFLFLFNADEACLFKNFFNSVFVKFLKSLVYIVFSFSTLRTDNMIIVFSK